MIIISDFWHLPTGEAVTSYKMSNAKGCSVSIIDYGCTIRKLVVPDKNGELRDVVLGFDKLECYLDSSINPYFGCIIGRYANRIGSGRVVVDGKKFKTSANETGKGVETTLHGGFKGFDKKLWSLTALSDEDPEVIRLTFECTSKDGEEGFPGNMTCVVDFTLGKTDNSLNIRCRATTDSKTVCNLTSHSYFNLNGHDTLGTIENHEFEIFSDAYIPIDQKCIPTGEIRSVEGTPFDFTRKKKIAQDLSDLNDQQLKIAFGYDHSFFSTTKQRGDLTLCSRHFSPRSGIILEISTTQPAVHFYTGNYIPHYKGKHGASYGKRSGFAMETQNLPDAMNHRNFPNCYLSPGEIYDELTIFKFSTSST